MLIFPIDGGGSCQIALTTEAQPTPSTKWSVIHSIMGGCPTNTTDGNLSETDAETVDPSTFQYTVPSDFAPGTYTLGVTWFNRVGNREMYMFCAPVTLTGGSGKKRGVEVRKAASRSKKGWFNKRANYPDLFKYVLLNLLLFPPFHFQHGRDANPFHSEQTSVPSATAAAPPHRLI